MCRSQPLFLELEWMWLKLDDFMEQPVGPSHEWALEDNSLHTPMLMMPPWAWHLQV